LDESGLPNLAIFVLLLALHALITLAYAALVNIRQSPLREQAESGDKRAQRIIDLTAGTTRLHTTYQLSLILLRFSIAAWVTIALIEPVVIQLPTLPPLLSYVALLFLFASITLVFGEVVPESVGSAYADALASWVITLMRGLVLLLNPVVAVLLAIGRVFSAAFGSSQHVSAVTEEEIMTLVDAGHTGGTIEEEEKAMIYSVLQLNQTVAREVMIPRIDVVALAIDTSLEEALRTFIDSGYSRIPVYEDNIDNIKGLLYAKDLLGLFHNGGREKHPSIQDLIRSAYFVPENKKADELLKELKAQKIHIAMVVDEYGGTAGLVTIENLIEEIIGDIVDEYDMNEEAEYVQESESEYLVDASIDLDDLNNLCHIDLPTEDSDTLGGFIYTWLGRVPRIGETIVTEDLVMRVESIEGRRIRKVHITLQRETDAATFQAGDAVPQTEEISE
jgi:CBS domain containing-hemolysin-like protein